jgi:formate hydrogenlyase subunit 3/multisubunit Na+/H+ antiporter MnhD subunit
VRAPALSPNLLAGLSLVVAALLLLALVAAVAPRHRAPLAYRGTLALCVLGLLLDLTFLLGGAAPCSLALPFGLPGAGLSLGLDGLSAFFLLLVMLAATATATAALDAQGEPTASTPFFPAFVGAMALTLLAADGFALVLGLALMSLAAFALVLTYPHEAGTRAAALSGLGMAAFGAACLVPALALLAHPLPGGVDFRFAAMRAHPPEGWRAALVLVLVLLGTGSRAGLAPLHIWLPPTLAAAPAPVAALMAGVMTKVPLYVLVRVLFDLCGPAQPGWWATPLLLLGAAGAVLGGLSANLEGDIKRVLACTTVANVGLITIGLGMALAARAADLSPLAALALGGALLHTMAHGLFKTLLFLAAGAVQHGAGSRRLERLGGLIRGMPVTTASVLIGGASLAALPPSAGFAGVWTLFQAVLAAPRVGGLAMPMLVAVVAMLMALAVALAAAAAVRLVGVAFLGRPRSPRAAATAEAGRSTRAALIALAGLSGAIGLFPGAVLALAGPALRLLVSLGLEGRIFVLRIAPQADAPGYAAPAVAVLLGLALALVLWLGRTRAIAGHRVGPAWDCGFGAPPPWLPFGDPLTQYSGASFGQPLRRALGALLAPRASVQASEPGDTSPARIEASFADPAAAWLLRPLARWRDRLCGLADAVQLLAVHRTLAVVFVVLVTFLAILALAGQP